MQYGVSVPNFGFGDADDPRVLAEWARAAEDAGWDGFFVWDHVLFDDYPHADPWIALAAIAVATRRIRIGPMVTPLPRRHLLQLARETVSLDILSGGRLVLGVGIGWRPWEWEQLGDEPDARVRGEKLDEGLDVLTRLWAGGPIAEQTKHYKLMPQLPGHEGPPTFAPQPVQRPRIPIWVAGSWPNKPPFRRAARWDGVVPIKVASQLAENRLTPDDVREMLAYISGHRTTTTPFDVVITGSTAGADATASATKLAGYAEAGATWWLEDCSPWGLGWNGTTPWPAQQMRQRILQGPPR